MSNLDKFWRQFNFGEANPVQKNWAGWAGCRYRDMLKLLAGGVSGGVSGGGGGGSVGCWGSWITNFKVVV